jgi:hypothetical protein
MEILSIWVIGLGYLLLISWACMVAMVLDYDLLPQMDKNWRLMALGFFAKDSAAWKWAIRLWFATSLVSAFGWVMGFWAVWSKLEQSLITDANAPEAMFLQLCIAQLAVLLLWTLVLFVVKPGHKLWGR